MAGEPDSFTVDVTQWVDRAGQRAEEAIWAIAEAALERVKELTPVRTGNLRANWQVVREDEGSAILRKAEATAKVGSTALGLAGRNVVGSILGGGVTFSEQIREGRSATEAGEVATASVAGAIVGAAAGQATGALAGSAVLPGIGTAVGGFVGGAAGSYLGENLGQFTLETAIGPATGPAITYRLLIINPVIYARAVEFGRVIQKNDGSEVHTHASGMVAQTVNEMPQIAERALSRLQQGP